MLCFIAGKQRQIQMLACWHVGRVFCFGFGIKPYLSNMCAGGRVQQKRVVTLSHSMTLHDFVLHNIMIDEYEYNLTPLPIFMRKSYYALILLLMRVFVLKFVAIFYTNSTL
jgi:hypothetical protein